MKPAGSMLLNECNDLSDSCILTRTAIITARRQPVIEAPPRRSGGVTTLPTRDAVFGR
jgi:hypothetical protein